MNVLDMELYWVLIDLHKAQRALIPPHITIEEITIVEEEDFTPVESEKTRTENSWILGNFIYTHQYENKH